MFDSWMYFNVGFQHVLMNNTYEHLLFLLAMSIPYLFKDWKRLLVLLLLFILGYLLSLTLSVFNVVYIRNGLVLVLVPVTVLITALYQLFTAGKTTKKDNSNAVALIVLFIGVIHGLGFANYFKDLIKNDVDNKLPALLEFTLGLQAAQIVVVVLFLFLSYIMQTFFRFSKRDWALVMAAFIIGVVFSKIIESPVWITKT